MAGFETDLSGFDDIMDELSEFPITCPMCNKEFNISINRESDTVTCPHCNAKIEIESE